MKYFIINYLSFFLFFFLFLVSVWGGGFKLFVTFSGPFFQFQSFDPNFVLWVYIKGEGCRLIIDSSCVTFVTS